MERAGAGRHAGARSTPSWSRSRRESIWLEIEINTDILFPSGSGDFRAGAVPVLDKLADVLKPFPNPDPRRGPYRRPADQAPRRSRRIGSCRPRAPPASCTNSPRRASIRCASKSSDSASTIRVQPNDIDRRAATRIAASSILVLESVAPGNPVTVKTDEQPSAPSRLVRCGNCRCRCRRKSATMARAARRIGQDGSGEGSSEGGCGQGFGCGERFAHDAGSSRSEGCAPDPISEVTHERS